jgi:hypothetical protein
MATSTTFYANSIDVVTSLDLRGHHGTFHFLDYVGGLDYELEHIPTSSYSSGSSRASLDIRQLEISLTPDRFREKIVEIPHSELSWAKKPHSANGLKTMHITEKGVVSEDEWNRMEASHAEPFVTSYVEWGLPSDRLIVLRDGHIDEYPLDFPVYGRLGRSGLGEESVLVRLRALDQKRSGPITDVSGLAANLEKMISRALRRWGAGSVIHSANLRSRVLLDFIAAMANTRMEPTRLGTEPLRGSFATLDHGQPVMLDGTSQCSKRLRSALILSLPMKVRQAFRTLRLSGNTGTTMPPREVPS